MFNFSDLTSILNHIIKKGAESRLTDSQFIVKEISNFKNSQKRADMLTGERYFKGKHDILFRERTVIGADGDLKTLQIEVYAENYKVILAEFKKALIENAMGYDAKADRLAVSAVAAGFSAIMNLQLTAKEGEV